MKHKLFILAGHKVPIGDISSLWLALESASRRWQYGVAASEI